MKNAADGGALVWVNFCKSPRVQPPESPDAAIPIVVLEPSIQPVNGGGRATLYEAVLAPTVCDRMDADAHFKAELIKVGLGCVEERSANLEKWPTVKVDHASMRVRDTPYKKKTMKEKLEEAAAKIQAESTEPFNLNVSAPPKQATPNVVLPTADRDVAGGSKTPDIVIPGLSSGTGAAEQAPSEAAHAAAPKNSVVIEELASTVSEQRAEGSAIVPTHACVFNDADNALAVTVNLPGVASVAEIVLDMEPRQLSLTAKGGYALVLALPRAVSVDDTRAKFKKKSQQLQLTLPVAS